MSVVRQACLVLIGLLFLVPLAAETPGYYVLGDFNGDGVFNGLDIPGFKEALVDPDGWAVRNPGRLHPDVLGDFNNDGALNGLDIAGFKTGLVQPGFELVPMPDGRPSLRLRRMGRDLIAPRHIPLYTPTPCEVTVEAEETPEGGKLRVRIVNNTASEAAIPILRVGGVMLPDDDAEIVEPWQTVRFKCATSLTPHRYYPGSIYAPVMGVRQGGVFVGAAACYDLFGTMRSVRIEYEYSATNGWTFEFHFNAEREDTTTVPPSDVLDPGESLEVMLAVGVAPGDDPDWVRAYRAYRDHFRETFGEPRYERSCEPILAWPSSLASQFSDTNPRGFLYNSGFQDNTRLDRVGWPHFNDYIQTTAVDRGFRRTMLWNPTGLYRVHRDCSMTWEIGTEWSPAMLDTAADFTAVCERDDMAVGFWWGRATSVSAGFDSGHRHAFDPDNPDDWQRSFDEIDPIYARGVRMVGMDATSRAIRERDWTPSSRVLFEDWFPVMTARYPEMRWTIEPAACDFLHLWGSSFVYYDRCTGPRHFADYLNPEQETNVCIKRTQIGSGQPPDTMQNLIDQYIRWGYTPIVFQTEMYPFRIKREMLPGAE